MEGDVDDDLVAVVEDVVEVVDGQRRRTRRHLRSDVAVVVDPHQHRQHGGRQRGNPEKNWVARYKNASTYPIYLSPCPSGDILPTIGLGK